MIEIGDYVRTENGEIHKIIEIIEDTDDWNYYKYENNMGDFEVNIAKHSQNLIDLLEEGDIAAFEMNNEVQFVRFDEGIIQNIGFDDIKEGAENGEYKILKILTHEQYDQNCYKVEEG